MNGACSLILPLVRVGRFHRRSYSVSWKIVTLTGRAPNGVISNERDEAVKPRQLPDSADGAGVSGHPILNAKRDDESGLCAPACVENHADDAVGAEPRVPEAGRLSASG